MNFYQRVVCLAVYNTMSKANATQIAMNLFGWGLLEASEKMTDIVVNSKLLGSEIVRYDTAVRVCAGKC